MSCDDIGILSPILKILHRTTPTFKRFEGTPVVLQLHIQQFRVILINMNIEYYIIGKSIQTKLNK